MATQPRTKKVDPAPVTEPVKQIEAAVSAGQETVEKVVKAGQDAAQQGYEQMVKMTQEQVDKASKMLFGGYDEVAEYGKANYDAYMKSVDVFTKSVEAIGQEVFTLTQTTVEKSVETSKAMIECKTVNEAVDLQNTYARETFDTLMAEGSKLAEMSIKASSEAFSPIQERLNITIEKVTKPIAA